jgi:hypothetical protein
MRDTIALVPGRIDMFRQIVSSTTCALLGVIAVASTSAMQNGGSKAPSCEPAGSLIRVPELPEGSGVAASRRTPGLFWAHNDSGQPVLVALDSKGTVRGRIRITGARVDDWEAVAVGPCDAGSCIYIGDIGDNNAMRHDVTIYRVPEPAETSGSAGGADALRFRYPDGAHDAEALLVTPKGDILIVTKGDSGPVALYRAPAGAKSGAIATLEPIGKPRKTGKTPPNERITDAAVSPGGAWIALRTNTAMLLYRSEDLMSGTWTEAARVSLKAFGEPQGEGIAFADERTVYLVGEGGGKKQPGTFGRVACTF